MGRYRRLAGIYLAYPHCAQRNGILTFSKMYDSFLPYSTASYIHNQPVIRWNGHRYITGIGNLSPLLGVEIVHFVVRSDLFKISKLMMEGKL
jgi:hypothetical protein